MKASSFERLQGLRQGITQSGYDMDAQRERFSLLAGRKENGTAPKAVSSFNLFQTPEPIALRMAGLVADHCSTTPRILEPSAGLGRIYKAITSTLPESRVLLVEQSSDCCSELYRIAKDGDRLLQRDFLEISPDEAGTFDAVCMNPPFKLGADIRHIRHALEMLTPGGILVSLCYNGTRQNEKLRPICSTWEVLPEGSFKSEGTGAGVVLLTILPNREGC